MSCECCEIAERRRQANEVHDFGLWYLNDKENSAPRPNLVLQLKAHRNAMRHLTPDEASSLGPVLQFVVSELEGLPGVVRVYVLLLNEAGHVHFHLVPRFFWEKGGDPIGLLGAATKSPDCKDGVIAAKEIHDNWLAIRHGA